MKKFGIILGSCLITLYLLFLFLPIVVTPIINKYSEDITKIIDESSGLRVNLGKMYFITTPKLTAGLKFSHIEVNIPAGETVAGIDNLRVKISLLPLLVRKIELDKISADNVQVNLKVRQDGHFLLEEYLPQGDPDAEAETSMQPLPFGFKLSNKLPDIVLGDYNISLIDMLTSQKYVLAGTKFKISDFILDKKIKVSAQGNLVLNDNERFIYSIRLFNKLMPDLQLNDLVFNPDTEDKTKDKEPSAFINVIDILKSINKTGLRAVLNADIKAAGTFEEPVITGYIDLNNLTMLVDGKELPSGHIKINAARNKVYVDGNLYSSEKESTVLNGEFGIGKNKSVDMAFKSNSQINSIFRILNSLAKSFNYNDLETLSATGVIDADFNLKSRKNHVTSSGYLRIPSAGIKYSLYNVSINNINADIDFNNMLNIKNIGLEIFGQPLSIHGMIQKNADTDIYIKSGNMLIKGLVAASGQMQILKENVFNSGTLSLDAEIKGNLNKIVPSVNLIVKNLDVKNLPSSTKIAMPEAKFVLNSEGKSFVGNLITKSLSVKNPFISFVVPETEIKIGEKDIDIQKAYIVLNNSRVDVTGKITDYMNNRMKINVKASGNLYSNDLKSMLPKDLQAMFGPAVGKMPINISISGDSKVQDVNVNLLADPSNYYSILNIKELKGRKTIVNADVKIFDDCAKISDAGLYVDNMNNPVAVISGLVSSLSKSQKLSLRFVIPNNYNMEIPGFNKSNMSLRANLDIGGTSANPHIKGLVSIPSLTIPDLALEINNLIANMNGPVLKGNGTIQKFRSGGIVSENLAAEFLLKNYSIFYLNNIMGDAFDGKISGNISYGINDGKIGVCLTGSGMNALKAIEGSAGIKNALSGTLGFKADIKTHGATDAEIMKNLSGRASFDIQNGKFLNVGRFDTLLYAKNILGNAVLKTLVTGVTNVPIIQNTAEFKTVDGTLLFNGGWAKISPIRSIGPLMAYYITGNYNLLNGTTNIIILGRLEEKVVSVLGPLGDLSVEKLTSYIPTFGALTGQLINAFTSDPSKEKTDNIPALSSGSDKYKDFKVEFNGGLESTSSVKSFKWLSKCDVSAIDYKKEIKDTVQTVKDTINSTKQDFIGTKEDIRKSVQETKQQIQDTKNELKNLFRGYMPIPSE